MGRSYPSEFRHGVVHRARSGRSVKSIASKLKLPKGTIFRWLAQDRIDRGERPGQTSTQRSDLAAARRRIRELETELSIIKEASEFYRSLDKIRPKGNTR